MRNTSSYHRQPFDLEDLDDVEQFASVEHPQSSNRYRRRVVTITKMVRLRIVEFLPDYDEDDETYVGRSPAGYGRYRSAA